MLDLLQLQEWNYKMYILINKTMVQRLSDNATIPFDPANTDYQAYLKWVDEGNTPEVAD
jgi:hypothetical protein